MRFVVYDIYSARDRVFESADSALSFMDQHGLTRCVLCHGESQFSLTAEEVERLQRHEEQPLIAALAGKTAALAGVSPEALIEALSE